jgi:surface polysaccharide O-acyltransferase-like enzyme
LKQIYHKHSNVGVELLRIFAMMMIVGMHYMNFGGILWSDAIWNRRIAWLLESFCFVSVNCYVLISGYFLVDSNSFHWYKVAKLWGDVIFYTLLFLVISLFYKGQELHLRDIVHAILPVRYQTYWFVTAYVGMYILSPYLNRLVRQLSKNEYQKFLGILMGMFSLYSFLRPEADPFFMQGGYTVWWFVVLYFLAGYVRLYGINISQRGAFSLYIIMCLLTFLSKKPMYYLFKAWGVSTSHFIGFYNYNSPTIVIASLALFILFLKGELSS